VLSALVMLPVGLGCLWLGGWAWAAIIVLAAIGLSLEFVSISGTAGGWAARLGLPIVSAVAAGLAAIGVPGIGLCLLAAATVLAWRLSGRLAPAFGVVYVGLASVALIWLRSGAETGRDSVLFVLFVVWATDIGAYAVGRIVGGPRLAPAISPGKTWSGALGGLAGALLIGAVAAIGGQSLPGLLLVAGALSVIAQAGDLLESAIKRHYGVKDSGHSIPGHGGLLDRLDGVLAAAPAAALLALAFGPGIGFWQ
jgi:phosphatidate cytidylyltransferase